MVAKVDYAAQKPSQVTFKKGQKIFVQAGAELSGWVRGRLEDTGEEGLFPATYLAIPEGLSSSGGGTSNAAVPKSPREDDEVLMVCKCLRDFQSDDTAYLSFKAHDRVEVVERMSGDLWRGRLKGRRGLVHASMLEEDKGFTIRRAAARKEEARGQFRDRRTKEQQNVTETSKKTTDIESLKKEQERLQQEREKLQEMKEAKKVERTKRQDSNFGDRLKQRSDQKKLEAEEKRRASQEKMPIE